MTNTVPLIKPTENRGLECNEMYANASGIFKSQILTQRIKPVVMPLDNEIISTPSSVRPPYLLAKPK
jgi:hypothetical protein